MYGISIGFKGVIMHGAEVLFLQGTRFICNLIELGVLE